MTTLSQEELKKVLDLHEKWLKGIKGGERAVLCYANLSNMDLRGVNLERADLSYSDFHSSDMSGANFRCADFTSSNLRYAKLVDTCFSEASLIGADLGGLDFNKNRTNLVNVNLIRANLSHSNLQLSCLDNVDLREANLSYSNISSSLFSKTNVSNARMCYANVFFTTFFKSNLNNTDFEYANLTDSIFKQVSTNGTNFRNTIIESRCPTEGSFVAWKKANKFIVKLLITDDAKRSSSTHGKCRCSKAKVLAIENVDGKMADVDSVASGYDNNFIYKIGEYVTVDNFDDNRWNECSSGIHFFMTREEAIRY